MSNENIVEGFLIGILSAVCVIYAFQTRVKYPLWIVKMYDHPSILLLTLILALYVFLINQKVGALLLLIISALIVDGILFARPHNFTSASHKHHNNIQFV
jgi:hypothetical protein